jgi:phospholipase C
VLLGACAAPAPPTPTTIPQPVPSASPSSAGPRHLFLIVMENREYEQVIGSAEAPYTNQLAREYGLAERYYAVAHPSLPNYLALVSGSTFGVTSDCTTCFQDAPTLASQLEAAGRTWRSYQADLPSPCFLGAQAGLYALKHAPLLYFRAIRDDAVRCRNVVPLTQLDVDVAADRVPDFAFVAPNLNDDMHDGSTAEGDRWLASFVPRVLASAAWRDGGVLVVTWDEGTSNAGCCGAPGGGHVATIVASASGPRGARSGAPTNHYGLLRTVEDAFGLPHLAQADSPGPASLMDLFAK